MDRNYALQLVKKKIAGPRFEHTVRVADTAINLAKQYGADVKKAELAAIFHDYAKLHPIAELKEVITANKIDPRLLSYHPELWHGPAAVPLLQKEVGIDDEDILNAIHHHTTGRANMSLLEQIVYVADYIEPGRQFPGVDEVRELSKVSLSSALMKALGNTIVFLINKKSPVFPDTFEAYNYLMIAEGGKNIEYE